MFIFIWKPQINGLQFFKMTIDVSEEYFYLLGNDAVKSEGIIVKTIFTRQTKFINEGSKPPDLFHEDRRIY